MNTFLWRSLGFLLLFTMAVSITAHPIMVDSDGLAINGYDTVAYHTQDAAVKGNRHYEAEWGNVTWQFVSAEHRELFIADPERYVPHYGSHCANAMSGGNKVDSNPEVFRIIDGELYLFARRWGEVQWRINPEPKIASANQHWQRFQRELGY